MATHAPITGAPTRARPILRLIDAIRPPAGPTRPAPALPPGPFASAAAALTRRAALAGAVVLPATAAIAALPTLAAAGATPFGRAHARYVAARDALNGNGALEAQDLAAYERLEAAYGDAADALDVTPCATLDELVDAIGAAHEDGMVIRHELAAKLYADARRLAGRR